MPFGQALDLYLRASGWTEERASRELGISKTVIKKMRSGTEPPSVMTFESFRQATGLDLYLLCYVYCCDHSSLPQERQDALAVMKESYSKELNELGSAMNQVTRRRF